MLEINKIYCADCLELMHEMEDNSVDLVLTDPPYGIGECGAKNHSRDSFPGFSKSKIGKPRTKKIKSTKKRNA